MLVPQHVFNQVEGDKAKMLDHISKFGWSYLAIHDNGVVEFCFTLGVYKTLHAPELLIYGLDYKTGHTLCSSYAHNVKCNALPAIGTPQHGYIEQFPVYFFEVEKNKYKNRLHAGRWLYKGDNFPCLQMVVPDVYGEFPWSDRFQPMLLGEQPDLTKRGWKSALKH